MTLDAYLGGDINGVNDYRSHTKFAQHMDGLRSQSGIGSSLSGSQAAAENNMKAHNIWVSHDKTDASNSGHVKDSIKGTSSISFN